MRRVIALAVLVLAAACSGGTDQAEVTTTTFEETTTTLAPEDAFRAAIARDISGIDDRTAEGLVGYALAECDLFDVTQQGADEDAPNDTPATDAALMPMVISVAYGADGLAGRGFDPAVIDVILRDTAEHLCPQHTGAIDDYIASRLDAAGRGQVGGT